MMTSIERAKLLDTLLNTLEAERYLRGPLLLEVLDALDAEELESAAAFARRMLQRLQTGRAAETEFNAEVAELRQLVLAATARATAAA
jgi:hypothetical protein